jgi:hypothetical protein
MTGTTSILRVDRSIKQPGIGFVSLIRPSPRHRFLKGKPPARHEIGCGSHYCRSGRLITDSYNWCQSPSGAGTISKYSGRDGFESDVVGGMFKRCLILPAHCWGRRAIGRTNTRSESKPPPAERLSVRLRCASSLKGIDSDD